MDNFNVNISVCDCFSSKCCNSNNCTTDILSSLNSFITLQNGYTLKLLNVQSTYVIVSIETDNIYIVRKCYIGIPVKICLSSNCICHTITIKINSIT